MQTDSHHPTSAEQFEYPAPTRRLRVRYRLRSLFVIITAIAAALAYASFHRPTSVAVNYEVGLVDAELMDLILARQDIHAATDENYGWFVNQGVPLSLRQSRGQLGFDSPGCHSLLYKTMLVTSWPAQVENAFYADQQFPERANSIASAMRQPESHIGSLGMYFGARRSGTEVEFRVAGLVTHGIRCLDADSSQRIHRQMQRQISFHGELPSEPLVFFARLDERSYHVVIVRAKEFPLSDGVRRV